MSESYVRGTNTPPLLEHTIGVALERAADKWQHRAAIIAPFQNIHWTYEDLNARADALATGFLELGLEPGDRIGIWAPNCAEWTLTQFAAAKVGIILVTINPAYRKAELDYALNKSGCRALVLAKAHRGVEFASMLGELIAEKKLPQLEQAILIGGKAAEGFLAFSDIAATKADDRVAKIGAVLNNTDAINIQFTSGTTGSPKGATLSHRNILNNGFFVGEAIGLSSADKLCIPVPLYHCFGMVMGNLGCLTHGSAMVYPSEGFDPQAVLQTVQDEKCTALYGVPTMFIAELGQSHFAEFDLSSLRTGIMAGSPCPIEVMRHVIDQMHMREVTIAYGMTETSPVSFQSSRSDSVDRRVSTVGRVLPHVEVKIVDEHGATVPRGMPGELCTRGPSVMLGYWDDAAKTAEAIDAEGWMHTGDIGTIDDEGYGNIVGRIKDMVIRGGENIYPREIEEFLYTHPDVDDAQVIGVPDAKYGEEICAWVRMKPGKGALDAQALRDFATGKLAHYKIPRYVHVVDEFPMTVTGKVRKVEMRAETVKLLGLDSAEG